MAGTGNICIIGAGNVGTHLYRWFDAGGIGISGVLSRRNTHPHIPGRLLKGHISEITEDTGLYILALPDDVLPGYIKDLSDNGALWAHTSGSLPLDILSDRFSRSGVFYPLQTFSRDIPMTYDDIPVLVECHEDRDRDLLIRVGKQLSSHVELMDSAQRLSLHVAAVFACNFTNHMMHGAEDILKASGTDLKLLAPLLRQTFGKAMESGPGKSQTGPAMRGDEVVMESHLSYLEAFPRWKALYEQISFSIQQQHKSPDDEH